MKTFGKMIAVAALAISANAVATSASATTVTFDNGMAGVAGLNYSGIWMGAKSWGQGFATGTASGNYNAYLYNGGTITTNAPSFTFNDALFTAAYCDNLTVTVTGFVKGVAAYAKSFTVGTKGPSLQTFDWAGLSSVQISLPGNYLVIDNLRVNEAVAAVPEPATWAMMLVGFGMIGAASRYRRRGVRMVVA